MAIIKNSEIRSAGEDVKKLELLCIPVENVKWYRPCRKQYSDSSKFKIKLPYDSVISVLGIYPKDLKAETQLFVHSFIAA